MIYSHEAGFTVGMQLVLNNFIFAVTNIGSSTRIQTSRMQNLQGLVSFKIAYSVCHVGSEISEVGLVVDGYPLSPSAVHYY